MSQTHPDPRPVALQCPTRVGGADALIAHTIPVGLCASRQAQHYHKCSTCANQAGSPCAPIPVRLLEPREAPRAPRSVAAG